MTEQPAAPKSDKRDAAAELRRYAREVAEEARLDAIEHASERRRAIVRAAGVALVTCTVAALVIWAWVGHATGAVRRVWRLL